MSAPALARTMRLPSAAIVEAVFCAAFLLPSLALGQERLDPIPDAPEQIVETLSPFRGNPDSSRVAHLLSDEAATSGFPTTDIDHVLVARLWRRAGETKRAMASLQAATIDDRDGGAADHLATYEAARVLFESGENDARGAEAYWRACSSTEDATRAELAWDHLAVMTPEERDQWADLEPGEPTCEWLRAFWDERAQRMAIPPDERIAIHFRRLGEAKRDYYIRRPRFLRGMADTHGRAPGLAIDDRGLLLVRMGEPHHDEPCPEEVAVKPDSFPNRLGRCWVYERPAGYKIFYLTTKDRFRAGSGVSEDDLGPQSWTDGDFKIQEDLGQQAEPGTSFYQTYVVNADLDAEVKARLERRGPASRLERLSREDLLLPKSERWSVMLDRAESRHTSRRITVDARRYTAEALEEIPDVPQVALTADLLFESLKFLNPTEGQWQIWLVGATRAGHLTRSDSEDSDATYDAGGRFSALGNGGLAVGRIRPVSVPARLIPPEAGISLRAAVEAEPGPLPVTFVIEDLNSPGTGAWIQDTVQVPAVGGLPQLSDIAIAQSDGGSWTRDGETYLQITPAHVTAADGSVHTYFEVYGVDPGTRYDVEFRMVPTDAADRIWRTDPGDLAFRLKFTSEMPGAIGRHHLRLDLSGTEPGQYVLAVRIQDEDTKAYSLPSVTDLFVATN